MAKTKVLISMYPPCAVSLIRYYVIPSICSCATSGTTMSVPMKSHLSPAWTISTASARNITSRLRGRGKGKEEREEGERREGREEREEGGEGGERGGRGGRGGRRERRKRLCGEKQGRENMGRRNGNERREKRKESEKGEGRGRGRKRVNCC